MGIGHVAVGFAAKRAVPEVSLALLIFAALFADVFFLFKRDRKGTLVVGLVLLSHWVLDAVSHGPDMPVFLHGPYLSRPRVVEFGRRHHRRRGSDAARRHARLFAGHARP